MRMRTILSFTLVPLLLLGIGLASSPARAQLLSDAELEAPRVIRYLSALPVHKGHTCYGLVLGDEKGVPTVVRALSDQFAQLCHAGDSPYDQARLMQWAFAAADVVSSREQPQPADGALSEVLDQLSGRQFVPFVALFSAREGRLGVVVTFLAVMELIKESLVEIVQTESFGPIHVKARAE